MEFLEFLKDILRILAVTALPAGIVWWWNGSTPRSKRTYTAYFWMFIIAVGLFGILFELFTTGHISEPAGYPSLNAPY